MDQFGYDEPADDGMEGDPQNRGRRIDKRSKFEIRAPSWGPEKAATGTPLRVWKELLEVWSERVTFDEESKGLHVYAELKGHAFQLVREHI